MRERSTKTAVRHTTDLPFRKRLRMARLNAGLTHAELAAELSERTEAPVTAARLRDVEAGRARAISNDGSDGVIAAHVCGVRPEWLLLAEHPILPHEDFVIPTEWAERGGALEMAVARAISAGRQGPPDGDEGRAVR